jgi:hypothetical protein
MSELNRKTKKGITHTLKLMFDADSSQVTIET